MQLLTFKGKPVMGFGARVSAAERDGGFSTLPSV